MVILFSRTKHLSRVTFKMHNYFFDVYSFEIFPFFARCFREPSCFIILEFAQSSDFFYSSILYYLILPFYLKYFTKSVNKHTHTPELKSSDRILYTMMIIYPYLAFLQQGREGYDMLVEEKQIP